MVGFGYSFFFKYFGGWGLWLMVVVAVAMAVVRGDELERLRLWRF